MLTFLRRYKCSLNDVYLVRMDRLLSGIAEAPAVLALIEEIVLVFIVDADHVYGFEPMRFRSDSYLRAGKEKLCALWRTND